jgi:uncharacterized protein YndB with AHSA1/START domain
MNKKNDDLKLPSVDVAAHLGAVTRELKSVQRDGRPAYVIVATRVFDTDIDDAWDAITSRERIPRWFTPIEGELRLGGRYQLKDNAGGVITTCEKPKHLALTWEMRGDVSWVDVLLARVTDNKTRLTLEHTAHVPEEFWNQYGPGAVGVGWDLALLGLALSLANPAFDGPTEGIAWAVTDEGKRYVRLASEDWVRASIANGTDAAKARAAGDATTAFYTGEPG